MMHVSRSPKETEIIAGNFVKELQPLLADASVVGLYGDLGSGKTLFVQGAAKALGIKQNITSPTFVIEKIYKLGSQPFEHLIHIDAYRLEKNEELLHLGWNEIVAGVGNLIFLEWPEKVAGILPQAMKKISFTFVDEHTREIEIE